MSIRTLMIACLAALAGCATSPPTPSASTSTGTPAAATASPPAGYATVYFYRMGGMLALRRPDVLVRNIVVAEPKDKTFTYVHVKAGPAPLLVQWTWDVGWLPVGFSRVFEAGKVYHFRVTAGTLQSQQTTLEEVSGTDAAREMAGCCVYQRPRLLKVD
jgi:hypothetical protein